MRIAVTRPEGASGGFAAALAARGHAAVSAPLLEIHGLSARLPEVSAYQALLATSANAFLDCGAETLAAARRLFAVGGATAEAARVAGAAAVQSAEGDGAALAELVERACDPKGGPLLYLAGRPRRFDLAGRLRGAGFTVEVIETYQAQTPETLPEALRTRLAKGDLDAVSFFSPRTAESFVRLTREAGLETACTGLTALCLSAAVAAELADLAWRRVTVAESPDQEALLAALVRDHGPEGAC
jgi:uroporphyrinogen-III synthase